MKTGSAAIASLALILAATFPALSAPARQPAVPPAIAAAVADPLRPAEDRPRDPLRKPAEVVAFAGVKPGDTVAEFLPGRGYFTRILAKAVGPAGHVYAIVPQSQAQRPGGLDAINAIAAAYPNVTVVPVDLTTFTLPTKVDVAWTSENYHDLHNGPTANPVAFDRAVFAALKPGGVFYIEDHSAPGTGVTATNTLHRIDPAAVISEVTSAGFRLEARSDLLANPADPHTARVFDPAIQGHTDKFAFRFRKPK
ncbi:MAG: class I SAM-dependent methyltransferase [Novosphingobium sp.]|nr:class I SAM-dependent methyltransferase [Novosphingobium sp.]